MTVTYTINHFVTTDDSTDPRTSTVHGDDELCIWTQSDPKTDAPDERLEAPQSGWSWVTNTSGWRKHPEPLSEYADNVNDVIRVEPWETVLTEGY